MLVTFSSKADMDILMLEKHAKQVLIAANKITGPEVPERGVFAPEQLDDAITALEHAIDHERKHVKPPSEQELEDDPEAAKQAKEYVMLAQRAAPLLTMLRKARDANVPVMWEKSTEW